MNELPRSTEQVVPIETIIDQRAKGWPDMHPEDHCHRCGNRNISWIIDSRIWDAVMIDAFTPFDGIVCPSCFGEMFVERFPDTSWELRLSDSRGSRAYYATETSWI